MDGNVGGRGRTVCKWTAGKWTVGRWTARRGRAMVESRMMVNRRRIDRTVRGVEVTSLRSRPAKDLPCDDLPCETAEGLARHCILRVSQVSNTETYRRTPCRSRSGSGRWLRFTPCVNRVSWSLDGRRRGDASTAAGRPDVRREACCYWITGVNVGSGVVSCQKRGLASETNSWKVA